MTESLTDPRASQSFVIVPRAQLQALCGLLFELIKHSHQALPDGARMDAEYRRAHVFSHEQMHALLDTFESVLK